jgi:chemotaxis protein CheX
MTHNLEEMLKAAATAVFPTMLNLNVTFKPQPDPMPDGPFVAGSIGFTGNFNGVFYMSTSTGFARRITCNMLGLSESMIEGDEMVNDALGELTNMHAGHIKTRLCDRGSACCMTIPTVIRCRDFRLQPTTGFQKQGICVCSNNDIVLLTFLNKTD